MKTTLRDVRTALWDEESGALGAVDNRHPYSNLRTAAALRAEREAVELAIKLLDVGINEGWDREHLELAKALIR